MDFLADVSSLPVIHPPPRDVYKCNHDGSYSTGRTAVLVLAIVSGLSYPDAFLLVSFESTTWRATLSSEARRPRATNYCKCQSGNSSWTQPNKNLTSSLAVEMFRLLRFINRGGCGSISSTAASRPQKYYSYPRYNVGHSRSRSITFLRRCVSFPLGMPFGSV